MCSSVLAGGVCFGFGLRAVHREIQYGGCRIGCQVRVQSLFVVRKVIAKIGRNLFSGGERKLRGAVALDVPFPPV